MLAHLRPTTTRKICVNASLAPPYPENARNQSSIDRLPDREEIFVPRLNEIKRQGLADGVTIVPLLKEIQLGFINSLGQ